jgi:hypothetical protein
MYLRCLITCFGIALQLLPWKFRNVGRLIWNQHIADSVIPFVCDSFFFLWVSTEFSDGMYSCRHVLELGCTTVAFVFCFF